MSAAFEKQKNTQAALYTMGITGGLLLLFFLVTMTIPQTQVPPVEEFVEVNLGSGDQGFGTDQPQLPGDPAPAQATSYSPPQPSASNDEAVKDVSDDNNEPDAPPVTKPAVSKPDATKINAESKTVKTNTPSPQPVSNPAPPRPRAVMGRTMGGNGNGGNGADTYRPGGNEGIAGGTGDQGRPGGDPNGRNYSGTPRNLSARVISIPATSFQDEFKESGIVALDIIVDENGRVTSANYNPGGSSITNRNQIEIAKRRVREVPFPKYEGGFKQRINMRFQVQ